MKTVLRLLVVVLLLAVPALAAKNIEVAFDYSGEAESYNFYMDGKKLCSAPAGSEKKFSCNDLEIGYGVHIFTMTANKPGGIETMHSQAYTWAYAPEQGAGPSLINLSITMENGAVVPIGSITVQK